MKLQPFEDLHDYTKDGLYSDEFIELIDSIHSAGNEIIKNLSGRFVKWDHSVQDAAYFEALVIGSSDVYLNEIRFSRYGRMVTLTDEDVLDMKDKAIVVRILEEYGFKYLSEAELGEPFRRRDRMNGDWFHRYFDYI